MAIRTATRLAVPTALAVALIVSGMPTALAVSHPSAPRSVHAKPGDGTVRITWVPPLSDGGSAVNGYAVQRSAASTGPWSGVATLAATTFAWKNTGLTNGTRYYFRVRAHNAVGWGTASTVVSAVPRTVPSAPQSPAATWGDATATVSWSAPVSDGGVPITGYRVQYSYDGTTWTYASAGLQTQLTVGGLSNGDGYQFVVQAHNAAGWGPASSRVWATPGVPQIPVDVHAESSAGGILVSCSDWEPGITWFDLEVSSNGGASWSWLPSYKGGPTDPGFSDTFTSGTMGQTYYFRVTAENSNGSSPPSSVVSAVFGLLPGPVGNLTVTYYGSPLFANAVGWSAPASGSPVQGYYVDRIVTEGPYVRVATVSASAFPSYYDSGVSHFTDYWYRITPYNQLGSGPSSAVHITTS